MRFNGSFRFYVLVFTHGENLIVKFLNWSINYRKAFYESQSEYIIGFLYFWCVNPIIQIFRLTLVECCTIIDTPDENFDYPVFSVRESYSNDGNCNRYELQLFRDKRKLLPLRVCQQKKVIDIVFWRVIL